MFLKILKIDNSKYFKEIIQLSKTDNSSLKHFNYENEKPPQNTIVYK